MSLPLGIAISENIKLHKHAIQLTQLELQGLKYLTPSLKLYLYLTDPELKEEKTTLFNEFSNSIQSLKPHGDSSSEEIKLHDEVIIKLNSLMISQNPPDILTLIRQILIDSSLILDPQNDSYFLMSALGIQFLNMQTLNSTDFLVADLEIALSHLKSKNFFIKDEDKIRDFIKYLKITPAEELNRDLLLSNSIILSQLLDNIIGNYQASHKSKLAFDIALPLAFWLAGIALAALVYFNILNIGQDLEGTIESQKKHLLAAQKLAILGEMSANISHEISTPLTVIRSSAKMIGKALPDDIDPMVYINVKRISRMTERIVEIMNSIKVLAHKQEELPASPQSINSTLDETLILLQEKISLNSVILEFNVTPNLPLCLSTESESVQVILNIAANAIDATDKQQERKLIFKSRIESEYVVICISDNGSGVPEELRSKIFESLFTTKPIGIGTGLGLAISKQIMERHGGKLLLNTDTTTGAQFDLYFRIA